MPQQASRVFYMPPPGGLASTPAAEPLPASLSMPAPAVLRALSEMPAPRASAAPPPAAAHPAPPPPPAVKSESQVQIPVEDWSPPAPVAVSSLAEDTVRAVAMSAANRKEKSSRRFSFFR